MAPTPADPRRCLSEGAERSDARTFECEERPPPAEAADLLRRIADGIRRGNLSVSMGGDPVTAFPAGELGLEIEAVEKKEEAKIEIEGSWTRGDGQDRDGDRSRRRGHGDGTGRVR